MCGGDECDVVFFTSILSFPVGRLAHEVGWQYQEVVKKLEAKRKVKSAARYEQKKTEMKLRKQAIANVAGKIAKLQKTINSMGYE